MSLIRLFSWGWMAIGLFLVLFKQAWEHFFPTLIPEWIDSALPPLQPPSFFHFWGTDELGRDVLIRLLFGTGYSLAFSFLVAVLTCILGISIGILISVSSTQFKKLLNLGTDTVSSLPFLPLALICLSFYPSNLPILGLLKSFLSWGPLAQFIRMESELVLNGPIIQSARSQGIPSFRILWKHLLPLVLPLGLSFFPFLVFSTVLTLSTLDYFGLGFPIPTPTLSEMFRQYQEHGEAWWLFIFPFLVTTSLLWNLQLTQNTYRSLMQQQAY
ncbi:MAG: ABC transporter permease [Proteobacteria bacterium]|nr:ABC transporter permease [Pseudomonadota bacterium]